MSESVVGASQASIPTPDKASIAAKLAVTGELFHPAAFGNGARFAETGGGDKSMFRPDADAGALRLPALSVHVPDPEAWFAPSLASFTSGEQLAMPEVASVPENLTVTTPEFQPAALGSGAPDALATGAVVSRRTSTACSAVPPSLVAEHASVIPAVSVVTDDAPQPVVAETGLSESTTAQVNETSPTYQL